MAGHGDTNGKKQTTTTKQTNEPRQTAKRANNATPTTTKKKKKKKENSGIIINVKSYACSACLHNYPFNMVPTILTMGMKTTTTKEANRNNKKGLDRVFRSGQVRPEAGEERNEALGVEWLKRFSTLARIGGISDLTVIFYILRKRAPKEQGGAS
jgi:hypothetical protein